eukprot:c18735_g1_i1.p1 GENE.c18735_g1_i1~~c18735_g1_i1.p1  ORF type:complete len:381 (+),score=67.16 c18735_g1_i1:259-1401(+)
MITPTNLLSRPNRSRWFCWVGAQAKIDEGDERWIVEERDDGRNVNAWHWEEKNVTRWAEDKYKEMHAGLTLVDRPGLSARITEVDSFSGEVSVNHRKGKTMVFFELNIGLKWEGTVSAGVPEAGEAEPERASGTIKMPYVADENGEDGDFDIDVALEKKKSSLNELLAAVKSDCRPILVRTLKQFLQGIRNKGTAMAPAKAGMPASDAAALPAALASAAATSGVVSATSGGGGGGASASRSASASTQSFEQTVELELPPEDAFAWFVDAGRVSAITMSAASISPLPGTDFSLFGGIVTGRNEEVQAPSRLVQKWRFASWAAGAVSRVEMTFVATPTGGTAITLKQSGIPKGDFERTKAGWQENYWTRFKNMLGFSVNFIK